MRARPIPASAWLGYAPHMKVCIVSDSHDRGEALDHAVRAAAEQGATAVIHCGDLIGGHTLHTAMRAGLPIHVIHGNNLGDTHTLQRLARDSEGRLHYHGGDARIELAGRKIFAVHYPEYGYAMACTGEWDLVCCGHSHAAEVRQVSNVLGSKSWLVNPGTVAGIGAPATWILADLAAMRFELQSL